MSNRDLIEVFSEVLRELQGKQEVNRECVEKCQVVVDDLTAELSELKEQESCAVHEDSEVIKKLDALRKYLNSIPERPSVLGEKLSSLQAAQHETAEKRAAATEHVRAKEKELSDAKTRLAVKKKEGEGLRNQWKDISERIAKMRDDDLL